MVAIAAALAAPSLNAATLTWDADPSVSGAQDGSGEWNTTSTNWWSVSGSNNLSWNSGTPDSAIFGASNGNAGVITLGENITANNVRLDLPGNGLGYILAPSSANTLSVASITPVTGTISAIRTTLAGSGGLTISGGGSVALAGPNTYTGATLISGGAQVSVNTLGNDGETSSSLGAPTGSNRTIILGSNNTAGILNYTGGATSVDRNIDISNANAGSQLLSNGSGKLTWTGNITGAHSFTLGGDGEGEMRGIFTQAAGNLAKTGYSNWTISSSGTNTIGPNGSFSGGSLVLDFSNLASATNLINSTSGPTFNGLHFKIVGNATTATSQTLSGISLSGGGSSAITLVSQGPAVSLALGNITRGFATSVNFTIPEGSAVTTSRSNGATTILGGWATYGGNTWAVSAGDSTNAGAITGLTTYSSDLATAGVDLDVPSGTNTISVAPNSIRFNNNAAARLNLGTNLAVASGGILVTSNVGANETVIGSSNALSSGSGDLVIHQHNTAGGLTIGATITSSFTKTGDGLLTLTGGNGGGITTRINAGTLSVGSPTPLGGNSGTNTIIFSVGSTGTLQFTSNLNTAKGITVNGNGIVEVVGSGTTATLNGANSVGGAGNLTKTGGGSLLFSSTNSANTFTGALIIKQGAVRVTTLGNAGVASGIGAGSADPAKLVLDGGVLQLTATANAPATTNRLFTLGASGGTIENANTTPANSMSFTGWGDIALTGSNAPRTLTLTGTNNGANRLVPSLGDNGSGASSLVKNGAGTWIVEGNNSYSGSTAINAGTLLVNALHNGAGNYTISGGATLGGDNGNITLAASKFISATGTSTNAANIANIAPGALSSIGTLTVSGGTGVQMGNFSNLIIDLGAGISDQFRVEQNLNLNSASDSLTFSGTADGVTDYVIATYGNLLGTFATINNLPNGYALDYGSGANSQITLEVVPEPGTAGVLVLGALVGLARRRRRVTTR